MTDDQINIAIAESLGWTQCRCVPLHKSQWENPNVAETVNNGMPPRAGSCTYPNYTADLNACHEAMLNHQRKELLRRFLYLEVLEDPTNTTNEPAWANAKQWATAYVKSIGKWVE